MRRGLLLLIASCGRLGFDPLDHASVGSDDGGSVLTGDAAIPNVCANASPEQCNGIDDNCDGRIDEGCACTAVMTTISESPSFYTFDLVWTGNELIQVAGDAATNGLQAVSSSGALIGFTKTYSGGTGTAGRASMAWSGSEVVVAAEDDTTTIKVARFDTAANTLGALTTIDTMYPGAGSHIAWAGDHFVIAWEATNGIAMRDLGRDSMPTGPEQLYATNGTALLGALAVSATRTIACLRDASDGTARILTVDEHQNSAEQSISLGTGDECRLVPTSGGYLAYYGKPSSAPVSFVLLDPNGNPTGGGALPAGTYNSVSIARLPDGNYWVAATSSPQQYTFTVNEFEMTSTGAVVGQITTADSLQSNSFSPPIVLTTDNRRISMWSTAAGLPSNNWKLAVTCN